ncbi:MAG: sodium-independent anion transporter [Flavobacteriaceae bacterium]|nr:sodium-independent anion transporter [Flavobacteriaceae bacterium]OUX39392.1 MAG: sodium-independent anion transporter [Flavobacteriaceae bacterium TMED265]
MIKRLFPILEWLPEYNQSKFYGDLSAGLTVGVMLIPQGMAYAMIAGLPPIFGLYAAFIPQLIYALMGTSGKLGVGPVAMDSLLVASGLGALSLSGIDQYIQMAVFLALFMGGIQVFMGLVKMGFLVNFLSKPVINGFTSAAAIIIGLSQLKHLLGTEIARSNQLQHLLYNAYLTIDEIHFGTLLIGLSGILGILLLNKISPKIPAALVITILAILVVWGFGMDETGVKIVSNIPSGLPELKLPSEYVLSNMNELFPIALTLSLVAFMEAISVAKAVEDEQSNLSLRPNQELIALGFANIVGSLFQSYPTTGGFSRTAVNNQLGASTPMSLIISAAIVGASLFFLTPLFYYLPNAVLAAIIMVAVAGLIDLKYPKRLWNYRKDEFGLLAFTFIVTLTVGITQGILFGILLSLLLMVYRTAQPHYAVLGNIKGSKYYRNINRFKEDVNEDTEVLIFRFDAQLYFGNKDFFKSELSSQIESKKESLKSIIINAESINYIDSSGVFMLDKFIAKLQKQGYKVYLAGAIGPVRDIIKNSGLEERIGSNFLFENTYEAHLYIKQNIEPNELHKKISHQSSTL